MRKYILLLLPIVLSFSSSGKPQHRAIVDYSILETGNTAALNYTEPTLVIMSDKQELEMFYRRLHSSTVPRPDAPDFDFSDKRIVFLSFGKQTTAGYAIELINVLMQENVLVVKAMISTPLKDSFQAQVITHPYMLIAVPRDRYRRVEMRDMKGEKLAFESL